MEMVIASPPRSSHFCFMRLTSLRDHPPGPGTSSNKPCGRIDRWIMHGFGLSLVVSLPAVKIGRSGWTMDPGMARSGAGHVARKFGRARVWSARARPHRSLARSPRTTSATFWSPASRRVDLDEYHSNS